MSIFVSIDNKKKLVASSIPVFYPHSPFYCPFGLFFFFFSKIYPFYSSGPCWRLSDPCRRLESEVHSILHLQHAHRNHRQLLHRQVGGGSVVCRASLRFKKQGIISIVFEDILRNQSFFEPKWSPSCKYDIVFTICFIFCPSLFPYNYLTGVDSGFVS